MDSRQSAAGEAREKAHDEGIVKYIAVGQIELLKQPVSSLKQLESKTGGNSTLLLKQRQLRSLGNG